MTQPYKYLEDVIKNKLQWSLNVIKVDVLPNNRYRLHTKNTSYLRTGIRFGLDDALKVDAFLINQYVEVVSATNLNVGSYLIRPPFFLYDKYKEANIKVAQIKGNTQFKPMVWYVEPNDRTLPTPLDSMIENEGVVRLIITDLDDFQQMSRSDRDKEIFEPLINGIVQPLWDYVYLDRSNVARLTSRRMQLWAKFTTGGMAITDDQQKNIFPEEVSAIELNFSLPIKISLNCIK